MGEEEEVSHADASRSSRAVSGFFFTIEAPQSLGLAILIQI
jgi:hypothetical protein